VCIFVVNKLCMDWLVCLVPVAQIGDASLRRHYCLDWLFRRGDRDLTFLCPVGTKALEVGLGWLTLRAREDAAVVSWRTRSEAGRDFDRDADDPVFLVPGVSVDELPPLGVPRSSVSGTLDLLTTVRTVVAVTVEPSLDEEELSGRAAHLHRPQSAQSLHVFTVDAATMSANVSIAEADVGLSGSDWTTSNSLCAVMTSSGVPSSYTCIAYTNILPSYTAVSATATTSVQIFYTVSQKMGHVHYASCKCGPIVIIRSLSYSWVNCRRKWCRIYHLTWNVSTHYLEKIECSTAQLLIHSDG